MPISNQQCRMARAALDLGVRDLAQLADVSPNTIARFERGDRLQRRTLDYIEGVLEAAGVIFIDPRSVSAEGGSGIRLRESAPTSKFGKLIEALWSVPDLRAEPEAAYAAILNVLSQYLDLIRDDTRDPDVWERIALNHVLNDMNRGNLFAAYSDMRNAITPPDNQSKDYPIAAEREAEVADLGLAYFRRCHAHLKARGYSAQFK